MSLRFLGSTSTLDAKRTGDPPAGSESRSPTGRCSQGVGRLSWRSTAEKGVRTDGRAGQGERRRGSGNAEPPGRGSAPPGRFAPDKQGACRDPQTLREYAGLERDVMVLGVDNRIELWNPVRWREQEAQGRADIASGEAFSDVRVHLTVRIAEVQHAGFIHAQLFHARSGATKRELETSTTGTTRCRH